MDGETVLLEALDRWKNICTIIEALSRKQNRSITQFNKGRIKYEAEDKAKGRQSRTLLARVRTLSWEVRRYGRVFSKRLIRFTFLSVAFQVWSKVSQQKHHLAAVQTAKSQALTWTC